MRNDATLVDDMRFLVCLSEHRMRKGSVDWVVIAELTGMANDASARSRWSRLKKKYKITPNNSRGRVKKEKTPKSKRLNDEDGDDEEPGVVKTEESGSILGFAVAAKPLEPGAQGKGKEGILGNVDEDKAAISLLENGNSSEDDKEAGDNDLDLMEFQKFRGVNAGGMDRQKFRGLNIGGMKQVRSIKQEPTDQGFDFLNFSERRSLGNAERSADPKGNTTAQATSNDNNSSDDDVILLDD